MYYRDLLMDRPQLIALRRKIVDRVTNLLPECELFSQEGLYPRRYFDDLMLPQTIPQEEHRMPATVSYSLPQIG